MAKTKAEIQRDYERRSGYKAKAKYDREKTRRYVVKVITTTEQDIIEKLDSVPSKAGYIKQLIRADIAKEEKKMKQVSINNGATYCTPAEALGSVTLDQLAQYMDDETREAVHAELAPCSDLEFLARYLELAPDDLIWG